MAKFQGGTLCDNCGVEITWTPHYVNPPAHQTGMRRAEYCCQDCANGLRCKCGERMLLDEDRRKQEDLPVEY